MAYHVPAVHILSYSKDRSLDFMLPNVSKFSDKDVQLLHSSRDKFKSAANTLSRLSEAKQHAIELGKRKDLVHINRTGHIEVDSKPASVFLVERRKIRSSSAETVLNLGSHRSSGSSKLMKASKLNSLIITPRETNFKDASWPPSDTKVENLAVPVNKQWLISCVVTDIQDKIEKKQNFQTCTPLELAVTTGKVLLKGRVQINEIGSVVLGITGKTSDEAFAKRKLDLRIKVSNKILERSQLLLDWELEGKIYKLKETLVTLTQDELISLGILTHDSLFVEWNILEKPMTEKSTARVLKLKWQENFERTTFNPSIANKYDEKEKTAKLCARESCSLSDVVRKMEAKEEFEMCHPFLIKNQFGSALFKGFIKIEQDGSTSFGISGKTANASFRDRELVLRIKISSKFLEGSELNLNWQQVGENYKLKETLVTLTKDELISLDILTHDSLFVEWNILEKSFTEKLISEKSAQARLVEDEMFSLKETDKHQSNPNEITSRSSKINVVQSCSLTDVVRKMEANEEFEMCHPFLIENPLGSALFKGFVKIEQDGTTSFGISGKTANASFRDRELVLRIKISSKFLEGSVLNLNWQQVGENYKLKETLVTLTKDELISLDVLTHDSLFVEWNILEKSFTEN